MILHANDIVYRALEWNSVYNNNGNIKFSVSPKARYTLYPCPRAVDTGSVYRA